MAALCVLALSVLYQADPRIPGFYPKCPTHQFLGIDCPGCGTLRAVYLVLHGQVWEACRYNAMTVLAGPFLAYSLLSDACMAVRGRGLPKPVLPAWYGRVIVAGLLTFTVARNLPGCPFAIPCAPKTTGHAPNTTGHMPPR